MEELTAREGGGGKKEKPPEGFYGRTVDVGGTQRRWNNRVLMNMSLSVWSVRERMKVFSRLIEGPPIINFFDHYLQLKVKEHNPLPLLGALASIN